MSGYHVVATSYTASQVTASTTASLPGVFGAPSTTSGYNMGGDVYTYVACGTGNLLGGGYGIKRSGSFTADYVGPAVVTGGVLTSFPGAATDSNAYLVIGKPAQLSNGMDLYAICGTAN